MTPDTFLDRIPWTQLARVVHGSPPEWEPESASVRAIRGVLAATELDAEEALVLARWEAGRESSLKLFDRLLQARASRAVREGLWARLRSGRGYCRTQSKRTETDRSPCRSAPTWRESASMRTIRATRKRSSRSPNCGLTC